MKIPSKVYGKLGEIIDQISPVFWDYHLNTFRFGFYYVFQFKGKHSLYIKIDPLSLETIIYTNIYNFVYKGVLEYDIKELIEEIMKYYPHSKIRNKI